MEQYVADAGSLLEEEEGDLIPIVESLLAVAHRLALYHVYLQKKHKRGRAELKSESGPAIPASSPR